MCRSGSKDIRLLQHGFLCFLLFLYLYFYSPPCIITHVCFFLFPRRVPSDLEVGYEKSILTRTEILFYYYLFQRTPVIYNFISQENVFLFAIYFHKNMKLGPAKFFCFVFATTSIEKSKAITPEKFSCSVLPVEGKSM